MLTVWSHSSDRHLWAVHWVLSPPWVPWHSPPKLLVSMHLVLCAHFTGKETDLIME